MPGPHDPRTDALLQPATYADAARLDGVLAELRADAPVAWNDTAGFWAVARHADVVAASTDPATYCSSQGILLDEIGTTYDSPPTMMHTDPPEHTRYRRLVAPGFRASVVRSLEAQVRGHSEQLLDELPIGEPVDIVAALAAPFPLRVIAAVLGLPPGDEERLWRWSDAAIPGATDLSDEERMEALTEMTVELLGLAAARRDAPADDVVSTLATFEDEGEQLTADELGMFLIQLLVAGNETTRHAISGAVVALAERPDEWRRLQGDRALVITAVEEVLRWTTPVTSFMRTATVDATLGGVAVAAGDPLLLLYASADRDEAEFGASAAEFDVGRNPNHHVAFGFGHHFCLGAALARLEIAAVLEGLLARVSAIEPVGTPERTGSSVIAGIRRAEVVLRA